MPLCSFDVMLHILRLALFCSSDWYQVRQLLSSNNVADYAVARDIIKGWRLRDARSIPAAVELTENILRACLFDNWCEHSTQFDSDDVRYYFATALIRFAISNYLSPVTKHFALSTSNPCFFDNTAN